MTARVLLLACLLAMPVAAPAVPCPCDCNGDGTVGINELLSAINVALGSAQVSSCPALPECPLDGICILIDTLVRCVDLALSGCPADPSPTPTPGPATLPGLLADLAPRICADVVSSTPGGRFSVAATDDAGEVRCSSFVGHEGWVRLERLASAAAATAAFGEPDPDETVVEIDGGRLRNRTTPDTRSGGTLQDWRWVRGCFLATGHAFDDTHFMLAPQPDLTAITIAAAPLFAELLASCAP